ncbi:facilitated trehalose transporter Tret1-like [Oratosquilla oratoria]|uniref:facilitated trehalose transporter Tret1-like n=1 Tax=Oratosquilla oratoria TaxID=337810 RepID=UPI003F76F4A3
MGSLVSGRISDHFGRRNTLLMTVPIYVAGWLSMAFAPTAIFVFVGRFICGFGNVITFIGTQLYSSEIPEARFRGRLASLPSLFISLGALLIYGLGAALPWRTGCLVVIAVPILFFFALLLIPESPYWLLLKDRDEEAVAAMRWLRGTHYDIDPELREMKEKLASVGSKAKISELWKPRTRKPFLIGILMQTLQQLCGANILIMYAGTFLMKSGSRVNPHMDVVYIGIVQLMVTLLAVGLMDKVGRKVLLIMSVSGVSVCMTAMATYFYVLSIGEEWPDWVPVVIIMGAACSYCIGCRSVPVLLTAELFNTTIRSTANSICTFYNRIIYLIMMQIKGTSESYKDYRLSMDRDAFNGDVQFVVGRVVLLYSQLPLVIIPYHPVSRPRLNTNHLLCFQQTFPFVETVVGTHTPLYFHGAIAFIGVIVTAIYVPETKGKSLEEIQEYFESDGKEKSKDLKPSENMAYVEEGN